jgi:hypothetical protein
MWDLGEDRWGCQATHRGVVAYVRQTKILGYGRRPINARVCGSAWVRDCCRVRVQAQAKSRVPGKGAAPGGEACRRVYAKRRSYPAAAHKDTA